MYKGIYEMPLASMALYHGTRPLKPEAISARGPWLWSWAAPPQRHRSCRQREGRSSPLRVLLAEEALEMATRGPSIPLQQSKGQGRKGGSGGGDGNTRERMVSQGTVLYCTCRE